MKRPWPNGRAALPMPRVVRPGGASKLDPYKTLLQRWLERHPFTATQLLQRLRAETDYPGGYSILSAYVRTARPARAPAFLTLAFAPGECAQVDWGCAGSLAVGSTRRRLSFFVLVLCYSRLCYYRVYAGRGDRTFPGRPPARLRVPRRGSGPNPPGQCQDGGLDTSPGDEAPLSSALP
jgi:transposase